MKSLKLSFVPLPKASLKVKQTPSQDPIEALAIRLAKSFEGADCGSALFGPPTTDSIWAAVEQLDGIDKLRVEWFARGLVYERDRVVLPAFRKAAKSEFMERVKLLAFTALTTIALIVAFVWLEGYG